MVLYNPRTSPSGQEAPIAVLKLSAPAAFTDGVQLALPFDTIAFIKGDAGRVITPLADGLCFGGGPGLWFGQCMCELSVANADRVDALLASSSGSNVILAHTQIGDTDELGSIVFGGHFLIPSSDTPLTPQFFAAFAASITVFGASGQVDVANTSLALWPMYGFDT